MVGFVPAIVNDATHPEHGDPRAAIALNGDDRECRDAVIDPERPDEHLAVWALLQHSFEFGVYDFASLTARNAVRPAFLGDGPRPTTWRLDRCKNQLFADVM
jgi:hypothetical protein